jgi:hypothetical protein
VQAPRRLCTGTSEETAEAPFRPLPELLAFSTTANTFIAMAEAISYTGARPVFVDVDPLTANIDLDLIQAATTRRTKAILPVHLYGRPVDLDPVMQIAARHSVVLLSRQEPERLWRRRGPDHQRR